MNIEIRIDGERCKGCNICVEVCQAKVLAAGAHENSRGYRPPVIWDPEGCLDCGICEMLCPDLAIIIHSGREDRIS